MTTRTNNDAITAVIAMTNATIGKEDVLPKLFVNSDDKFNRLAVMVGGMNTKSIDVIDEDGALLMRLNISNFAVGRRNIDVIFKPKDTAGVIVQVFRSDGRAVFEEERSSLVSVSNM